MFPSFGDFSSAGPNVPGTFDNYCMNDYVGGKNHFIPAYYGYLKVVTNEKGEAVGEVVTIIC
jgi:hypothetical protein